MRFSGVHPDRRAGSGPPDETRQPGAVDADQPFHALQRAGMTTAVMDEVPRRRDASLAAADMRDGHPELALRTLGARMHESGDRR